MSSTLSPIAASADSPAAPSRTTMRIHPERAAPDEAAAILSEGVVAHVGFTDGEQPFVIPMTYHFDAAAPGLVHLHGAHHSRLMAHLASGAPVCITVTLVDGLVYSRTALHHSVNYRSVVCFGRVAPLPEAAAQRALLEAMIARYFAGRTAGRDYDVIPEAHIDATAFVSIAIEEWSAKARRGGPKGPRDDDADAPGTAGVVPMTAR
jgi:nitroimidazol reductase NimA-like FMN-containing flavoprotein (pyridoxamine 5'-phosphate oxidase superfamily)